MGYPATATLPLTAGQAPAASAPAGDPRRKSRALATILSLLPGLGQVYTGYNKRGFMLIAIYVSTICVLSSGAAGDLEPLFGISLAFIIFYAMIDANRLATTHNLALDGFAVAEPQDDFIMRGNRGSIIGGSLLLFLGFLLFMHITFDVTMDWLVDLWPLVMIGIGGYLIRQGLRSRREERERS